MSVFDLCYIVFLILIFEIFSNKTCKLWVKSFIKYRLMTMRIKLLKCFVLNIFKEIYVYILEKYKTNITVIPIYILSLPNTHKMLLEICSFELFVNWFTIIFILIEKKVLYKTVHHSL